MYLGPKLILIRGLPGSGKSTLARSLRYYINVEADTYFLNDEGDYIFDSTKIKEAHAWCLADTELNLTYLRSVAVSNTFTQMWEMQPYIDLAKKLYIPFHVVECKGNFGSIHGVPQEVIERMKSRWEEYKE